MPGFRRLCTGSVLVGVLLVCPSALSAQSIEGRVVGSWAGQPVRGAVMVLTGTAHQVITDSSGRFFVDSLAVGRYELLVQHPGYRTVVRTVDVPPDGLSDLVITLPLRVIALDPIRAEVISPLERRRRSWGTAHHVYVTRQELDAYERRGALHVGDALRLHAPTAVRIVEYGITRARYGPGVCIVSKRAATRRTPENPGGGCAAVFIDGLRISGADMLLHGLPLNEIEAVEFLPPMDAIMRLGHAGSAGAVLITTRRGGPVAGRPLQPVEPLTPLSPEGTGHSGYLAAGATAGFVAAFGVRYGYGLFRPGAESCNADCGFDLLQLFGPVVAGLGIGELVWRTGPGG